jgi:two-component system, NarL family, nitrate/nitrite response regulator NarL
MSTPASSIKPVKVVIRCARRLCRDALASRIASEPEFVVAGHVDDDDALLDLCQLSRPDVILFDVCSQGMAAALGTLGAIRDRFQRTKVVVIYERLSPTDVAATWPVGVDMLIPCSHGMDAVLLVLNRYVANGAADAHPAVPPNGGLTDQELHILALVATGHSVSRISDLLGVSARTVDNFKRRAYHKLGAANQGQAVARAAALGLLDPALPTRLPIYAPGQPLVVLRGPVSEARDRTIVALLAGGIAFVVEEPGRDGAPVTWEHRSRGPVLVVVVEPATTGANLHGGEGIPTVLIRSAPMRHGEAMSLLRRGVIGIIAPDRIAQTLVPALTLAASGHLTVDPAAASTLVATGGRQDVNDGRLPEITTREGDILRSIATGDTVRQTARALGIAPKTVENIQARLFRKLGVRNRAAAIATVHALGLLEPLSTNGHAPDGQPLL